jgi:indolepyruvate ferredoxin oxidoreductase
MHAELEAAVGKSHADFVDATRLATALLGDAIATNPFMLGFAYQKGLVPVSAAAIERAIELNGVAVDANKKAFLWGRRAAHDPSRVEKAATPAEVIAIGQHLSRTLDETIARRVEFLTDYQDAAYAARYRALVVRARQVEADRGLGTKLAESVARNYFKLMAYKDEYEVARLYTNGEFRERLNATFEGDFTIKFNLAPPLLARRDTRGRLVKAQYGSWMWRAFRLLAPFKFLRGTALDPFGSTEERRLERQLIADYRASIEAALANLSEEKLAAAVELAGLPEQIRGFGHVKLASIEEVRARWKLLERELSGPKGSPALPLRAA